MPRRPLTSVTKISRAGLAAYLLVGGLLAVAPVGADICAVPADRPTIQSAVDDLSCTEIALAPQTFGESAEIGRDLTLRGQSSSATSIHGQLRIGGATTDVRVELLRLDASVPSVAGCFEVALDVSGGARVSGLDLVVVNSAEGGCGSGLEIFADGFESGDTTAWTHAVP